MDHMIARRRLMSTTMLACAGAAAALVAGTRHARALSLEIMNPETQRLYASACTTRDDAYHRQLVAEVRQTLQNKFSEAEIEATIAKATCPICGCPIAAS
jgi:hypothetical protein